MIKSAVTLLNITEVAAVKPEPEMVTVPPVLLLGGENPPICGWFITVKTAPLAIAPLGVTTVIGPVVDPAGTTALIEVELKTVKFAAAMPLKLTAVVPVKLEPIIRTVVPGGPLRGSIEVIVGFGGVWVTVIVNVKLVEHSEESETTMVKVNEPALVGVPEISPS